MLPSWLDQLLCVFLGGKVFLLLFSECQTPIFQKPNEPWEGYAADIPDFGGIC